MDCHEDQEFTASAPQSPSQQPRGQAAWAALRDQQDQPALQGPPGVVPMNSRQSFGLKRIGAVRSIGVAGGAGLGVLLLAALILFAPGARLHAAPLPVQPGADAVFPDEAPAEEAPAGETGPDNASPDNGFDDAGPQGGIEDVPLGQTGED